MEQTKESRNAVAFIRNNNWQAWAEYLPHGAANGYVAVPPGNRFWGKHYDNVDGVYVHGGLTFSEPVKLTDEMDAEPYYMEEYVGKMNPIFDNAEFIDGRMEDIGDDWWVFGFDTFHAGDSIEEWDRAAVIRETLDLMEQLTESDKEK